MLSFEKKYFVHKVLLGAIFVLAGWFTARELADSVWLWVMIAAIVLFMAVYIWTLVAKSEPQDEYAKENCAKAKAHMYDLILLLLIVNTLLGNVVELKITRGRVLAVIGVLQIAEYVHFLMLEKRLSA